MVEENTRFQSIAELIDYVEREAEKRVAEMKTSTSNLTKPMIKSS